MGTQLPQKRHSSPPIFGPCLLQPNGWMDQDTTWYGGRPRPRRHCVKWRLSSPTERGTAGPNFWPMLYCGQTVAHLSMQLLSSCPYSELPKLYVARNIRASYALRILRRTYRCGSCSIKMWKLGPRSLLPFSLTFRCPAMPSYGCLAQYCGNVGPQICGALFGLTV